MNYFPMFADLHGRPVLVVGGGTVAERKIQSLLDAGAKVLLAARELTENLQTWAEEGRICRIAESFSDGLIRQAVLIIAATDDEELNRRVPKRSAVTINLLSCVPFFGVVAKP